MAERDLITRLKVEKTGRGDEELVASLASVDKGIEQVAASSKVVTAQLKEADKGAEKLSRSLASLEEASKALNGELRKSEIEALGDEVKETISPLDKLRQEIEKVETAFEKARRASISLKSESKALRQSGEGTKEEFARLSQAIEEAEKAELEAINRTRALVAEFTQLEAKTGQTSDEFRGLTGRLDQAQGHIDGIRPATKAVTGAMGELTGEVKGVSGAVSKLGEDLIGGAKHLAAIGTGIFAIITVAGQATQAIREFGKESVEEFRQFDKQIRLTFTVMDKLTDESRREFRRLASSAAEELGRTSEEINTALFQALSLGIPEENVFAEIAEVSKAARAGNADLVNTLITGQSVVNAYKDANLDLHRVLELQFFTVGRTNLTLEDLNQGMSAITSVANEAKVSFEDVAAAIIVSNRQGDSFNETAELMSNLLAQIQIEGTAVGSAFKEAAGIGFVEFIAQGGNLAEAIGILEQHAKSTGDTLLNMVGGSSSFYRDIQAARAVVTLAGKNLAQFEELSQEARSSTDDYNRAIQETSGSLDEQVQQTDEAIARMKRLTGEALEPTTRAWLDLKKAMADSVSTTIEVDMAIEQTEADLARLREESNLLSSQIFRMGGEMKTVSQGDFAAFMRGLSSEFPDFNQGLEDAEQRSKALNIALSLVEGGFKGTGEELLALSLATLDNIEAQEAQALAFAAVAEEAREARVAALLFNDKTKDAFQESGKGLTQIVKALEVLDGDTVKINLEGELTTLRFRNVNTPELSDNQPFAQEAREFTQDFLDNNPLKIGATMDRKSFDRIIADVPELERELIAQGLALPLPVELTENDAFTAELNELARDAAEAGRGLFENDEVAQAFLAGRINSMEQVVALYEAQEERQRRLNVLFEQAKQPVDELLTALGELGQLDNATSLEEEQARIEAANEAIIQSYREVAAAAFLARNPLIDEEGRLDEGALAIASALGVVDESTVRLQLTIANTKLEVQELVESQDELLLSDEELLESIGLIAEGYVGTAEQAAALAGFLSEDMVNAYIASSKEGGNVIATLSEIGIKLDAIPKEITVAIKTDLSRFEIPGGYAPGYQGGGIPEFHDGGSYQAGQPMIVGDGPGGEILPTTELLIPRQGGSVVSGPDLQQLMGGTRQAITIEGGITVNITPNQQGYLDAGIIAQSVLEELGQMTRG